MSLQIEPATEITLQHLEKMIAELDACPPEKDTIWRLNQKAVLGSYANLLIFTIRYWQDKGRQYTERISHQSALLENLEAAYTAEHTRYVNMKARALEAEELEAENRRLAAKVQAYNNDRHTEQQARLQAESQLAAMQAELEACHDQHTQYNDMWAERDQLLIDKAELQEALDRAAEEHTAALDTIDRLSNELHICKHDLGRCD